MGFCFSGNNISVKVCFICVKSVIFNLTFLHPQSYEVRSRERRVGQEAVTVGSSEQNTGGTAETAPSGI